MQQQWSAVDSYLVESLIPSDPLLQQVLENNQRAGLPAYDVAANQGQFLALLVRITRARRVLEIGTLGGCWRSARSAAIALSGWRASCRRTASC
jgi:predicted O-methyltransferase YrrM